MNRRAFLYGFIATALAVPPAAEARQAKRVYRIAYLGTFPTQPATPHISEAFLEGLRDHGYVEGENLIIVPRYSEGRMERFPALAAELVALEPEMPEIIVAAAAPATRAAKEATATIPIVGIVLADPVGQGLVASLARPGGNVTDPPPSFQSWPLSDSRYCKKPF